jgi:hypothetical protein
VHGRGLERNEQLVGTGVELGLADGLYDFRGVTEAVQAKSVHQA